MRAGKCWLAHDDPSWLAGRHGLGASIAPNVAAMAAALKSVEAKATLGASHGIGLGLGSISTSTRAKAAKLRIQAPYWYRFNVGEAEITVVSDGWQMLGEPIREREGSAKGSMAGLNYPNWKKSDVASIG